MFKKIYSIVFCTLIIFISGQKSHTSDKSKNDLYKAMTGKYEKDLCTPTNDYGFAICELYTFTIQKDYNILNVDGQNIEKEIKLFSKKISSDSYQIYDKHGNNIGKVYNVNGTFYFKYNNFLKNAEEKMKNEGYKFNKIE